MITFLKDLWLRLEVHWHVIAVAFVTAVPVLMDQLGYIDLQPILEHFLSPEWASLIVGLLPFALAFLKPMIHFPVEEDHEE